MHNIALYSVNISMFVHKSLGFAQVLTLLFSLRGLYFCHPANNRSHFPVFSLYWQMSHCFQALQASLALTVVFGASVYTTKTSPSSIHFIMSEYTNLVVLKDYKTRCTIRRRKEALIFNPTCSTTR